MISTAHQAMTTGLAPTACTLVRIAVSRSTSRSSRSGTDTALAANTSAATTPPKAIQTMNRFEFCDRTT